MIAGGVVASGSVPIAISWDCVVASSQQEALSGKLVFFNWKGFPRWPGIIVPPRMKSLLVHCLGYKKVAITLIHQRSSLWSAPTRDCLRTRAAAFEQGIKGLEFGKETWF